MNAKTIATYPPTASHGLAKAMPVSAAIAKGAGAQARVCARRWRALRAGDVSLAAYAPYHHTRLYATPPTVAAAP